MKLSILIPTYNRYEYLKKNILQLSSYIIDNNLQDVIQIIVSNNNSTDKTQDTLTLLQKTIDIKLIVYNQVENIGLKKNALFVLEKADTDYIMYLGDDDFILEDYLLRVIQEIKMNKLHVILPSYRNISIDGEDIGFGRDIGLKNQYYQKGFYSCFINSWRGHQLSGIVLKRNNLLKSYKTAKVDNIYLFIYFVAYSSLEGDLLHLVEYPIAVTRPPQDTKDWSYGKDGLLSEIFDNYKKLEKINFLQRTLLEYRMLDMQYWRYVMYLKLSISDFVKAVYYIVTGENTSIITKITFPFMIPILLLKKVVDLSIKGELVKTVFRKVDLKKDKN